jgi:two-component system LytT family response regulator
MNGSLPNLEESLAAIPLRIVIADDEFLCREKVKILLRSEPNVQLLAECSKPEETVAALQSLRPDLLLLDIQMSGGSGFDVLDRVAAEHRPRVIFTTAYDQYAIRAFEARALDYLLKPFDQQRFHDALERARVDVLKSRQGTLAAQLMEMARQPHPPPSDRFIVKNKGRVVFLNPGDIHWIEAAANYVRLQTVHESYLVRETIGHVAERLPGAQFLRIHRSIIVNSAKIKEVQPCNAGEYIVVLQSGKELSCSRKYRASIRHLLGKF